MASEPCSLFFVIEVAAVKDDKFTVVAVKSKVRALTT
jgi:hypothetical protein